MKTLILSIKHGDHYDFIRRAEVSEDKIELVKVIVHRGVESEIIRYPLTKDELLMLKKIVDE